MVKSRKSLAIVNFLIALFLIFSFVSPIMVYADIASVETTGIADSDIESAITATNKKMGTDAAGAVDKITIKSKGTNLVVAKFSNGLFTITDDWKNAKDSERSKAMRAFVESLSESGSSPDAIQSFMSNLQDQDSSVSAVMLPLIFESTKGDMYQAYKITSPFLNILSIVLGVGAVILILLLLFSTVMDLAYIGLPVWREAQAGKEGGKKHPFGVSYEALTTVTEIEKGLGGGDGGYRNAYLLYFRRRALTYIILAICIMYLIGGGLSGIIGFILSLVSGITG